MRRWMIRGFVGIVGTTTSAMGVLQKYRQRGLVMSSAGFYNIHNSFMPRYGVAITMLVVWVAHFLKEILQTIHDSRFMLLV